MGRLFVKGALVLLDMTLIHRSWTWTLNIVAGTVMAAGGLASVVGFGWVVGHW